MATIGKLLALIEASLVTGEQNLLRKGQLRKLRQLRTELGDVISREIEIPEPPKPRRKKKKLEEPTKEFWEALEEPSVEPADGADAESDSAAEEA